MSGGGLVGLTKKEMPMPIRAVPCVKGELYHIYNRSIADYLIFNSNAEYTRMQEMLLYYNNADVKVRFSEIKRLQDIHFINFCSSGDNIVDIIAYCIMPTHIHLILSGFTDDTIRIFVSAIFKSYSLYFNRKRGRKGPLWEGRFQNVLVGNEDQLLHLTRYIHLNPTTAYLVNTPSEWPYSSYNEYLGKKIEYTICPNFKKYIQIEPLIYEKFTNEQIGYQRKLAQLKKNAFV